MDTIIQILARELGRSEAHVENVVRLIDEGNTIPFIARYRKELHGAMDDTSLRTLEERLGYLRGLEERRAAVKNAIDEQGKLTDELAAAIDSAKTLAEVEDLYRPYKQKRRTRATIAKEKGLAPLAALLFAQERGCPQPEVVAQDFLDPEKGVETVEDALHFFENIPGIKRKLQTLFDVGLGYIRLGQPATTLSGGEAQRVKLASELQKRQSGKTFYILDEPTTGLHFEDVRQLLEVLQRLVDAGNTVLVIEHNLDVIKCADHIVDLGPEGGDRGGTIVAQGTPEEVAEVEGSYTGHFVKRMLEADRQLAAAS